MTSRHAPIGRTGCSLCRCPRRYRIEDGDVDCPYPAQAFADLGGAAERLRSALVKLEEELAFFEEN